MKTCLKCHKSTIDAGAEKCPHCKTELVLVEEFFYSAISELNEKGYYTKMCRPGAILENIKTGAFIIFDECVDSFPTDVKFPEKYKLKVEGEPGSQYILLTREFEENEDPCDAIANAVATYLWAVKLPAVGTDEYFNQEKMCYINNIGR